MDKLKLVRKGIALLIILAMVWLNVSLDFNLQDKSLIFLGQEAFAESDMDRSYIVAGYFYTLALMNDGTVKAWGDNSNGQLGLEDTVIRLTPTAVSGLSDVKQIDAGYEHTLALMNDGTVKAWGWNFYGQLGLGDQTRRLTLTTIPNLSDVKRIVAGYDSTFVLMNDSTVKACGYNGQGELGLGDRVIRLEFTVIPGLSNVKQITAGTYHTLALMNDGTVKAWGDNSYGQLGLGDKTDRLTPTAIPGLSNVKQIVAGHEHTLALMNDGTVKAWGLNVYGQLGLGDTTNRLIPTTIPGLSNVKQISERKGSHTLVLMNDGTIKAWGKNMQGELGLGDTTNRKIPTAIPGLSNVKQITTGGNHNLAVMTDNTVKGWGANANRQLGLGDTTDRKTPTTIPNLVINLPPDMSVVLPVENYIFKETDTNVTPTVTVSDVDNDILTCKYYLDSEPVPRDTKTVSNSSTAKTVVFNPVNMNTLLGGSHTMRFEVADIHAVKQVSVNFQVDKSAPTLNTVTFTPSSNSITLSGSATDSVSGLDAYPYRYTLGATPTSWLTSTSYTFGSLQPNTQYVVKFEARDAIGHIANSTKNIYTLAQVPSLTANNPSSYTLDVIVSDGNPPATQYLITAGAKYVTTEGTLTASPTWITLPNKRITVSGLNPSTTYTFQAKAKNGDGIETELSSPASGTTLVAPPGSPANITATATHTSITVNWDAIAGAISYDIEVDGSIVNNGTNTTYTHDNLTPGTPHTYRIRANNAGGNGNWSAPITKSTSPESPYLPLNINAAATDTKVILTWDAVAGATGYDIEVDSSVVNNGSSTNYVHAGLLPGTTHSYRVRSINAGGKSEWSSEVLVTTQVDTPQTPSNIETTEGKTQIVVTWDAVAGATGYDIEVDGFIADNGTRTIYTHSNLAPGTQHTYRVRSKKQGIVSGWSALLTATTLEDVFGKPTNFKAAATDTTVTLTWDPVYAATGYEVEADGIVTDNGTDTVCIFGNLAPESHHTYRVRARNGEVASEWSEYQAIETFALPTPSDFSVTSTETTVTAVWDAVYEADYYGLEMDGTVTGDVYGTTFTYEGLSPNTQHILRVRAENQRGISAWSLPFYISTLSTQDHSQLSIITKSRNTSITVTWGSVEEATGYDIEKDGQTIENVPDVSYLDDNLEPGTQHVYRVRVRNGTEIGEWSGEVTASTLPSGPVTPTNIIASATTSSILVNWDAVENAAEYEIEVDGQIINAGSGTSYLHSGLPSESQHTYRVRSKNISETSPWSDLLTVTTKSSTQTFTLNCTAGEVFNLMLTASNIENLSQQIFTVTYNPDELEVVDLCGSTPRLDTNPGNIIGMDVQIIQYQPGTIMFAKIGNTSPGQIWSGTVNTVKFKSKIDGQLNITFTSQ